MTTVRNCRESTNTSQKHHPENFIRMIVQTGLSKLENTNFHEISMISEILEFHDIIGL